MCCVCVYTVLGIYIYFVSNIYIRYLNRTRNIQQQRRPRRTYERKTFLFRLQCYFELGFHRTVTIDQARIAIYRSGGQRYFYYRRGEATPKQKFNLVEWSIRCFLILQWARFVELRRKPKTVNIKIFLSRIVLIYREIEKKRKKKRSVLLCECVCKIHNIFCNLCVFHCECWTVCVSDLYVICILIEAKEICTSNLFSFGFGWYSVLFSVYVFDGCMCVCVCVWFILSELFISRLFREQFINKFFGLPLAHHRTLTDTHTHTHIQNEFFLFLCWFHSLISVLHMCVEMNFKLYSSSCIYMFGLFLSSPPHQSNIQSERHETIWT